MKPLCLSFWTPPQLRPQAILIGKMVPEWQRQGVDPMVVGYATGTPWEIPVAVKRIPKPPRSWLGRQLPFVSRWEKQLYLERIYRQTAPLIDQHQLDIVFAFAKPMVSNFLGAFLKRRLGVPFVAHFSDPIVDDPFHDPSPKAAREILAGERFVLENCDRAVFVSEELMARTLRHYPESIQRLGRVVPHCYEAALYPPQPLSPEIPTKHPQNPFILSHIGAYYPSRDPEPVLRALAWLKEHHPELAGRFIFESIGGVGGYAGYSREDWQGLVNRYGVQEWVTLTPPVSYAESLARMSRADCLLLLDADLEESPFLPSKLIDYIGSGRPVIALTPGGSPSQRVVSQLGGWQFRHQEIEGLAACLGELATGGRPPVMDQAYGASFDVRHTSRKLLDIFSETLEK
ncbi:MAG: glycosyltransferase [Magnetococcales bacterium]|nr:glycosyltransferase [Magnetococcales bacterium]